ncbi:MAG: DUF433 domain-containing protein [Chloroflexi bacterium]|nr:DUF433 domain-containing protein [Chloroflexota bacterium]
MREKPNGWRTGAMYTIREAARLAGVSKGTVRNWLAGYKTNSGTLQRPVFGTAHDAPMVSFLQLIEIIMASRFRRRRVNLERIRLSHENAQKMFGVEYPFAHLQLLAWAGHILHVQEKGDEGLPALDSPSLYTLPGLVQEAYEAIDYEDELAARWYPLGKDKPIVVDPLYAAGLPTIPHRGVTIEHVKARFDAGQSIGLICRDLTLLRREVEEAIRYADKIAA